MSARFASPGEKGRVLREVPKVSEVEEELDLLDRVVAAMGDSVLQAYNSTEAGLDFEKPITKDGEPYTHEEMVHELGEQYNLSEEMAVLVIAATKDALSERNNVE